MSTNIALLCANESVCEYAQFLLSNIFDDCLGTLCTPKKMIFYIEPINTTKASRPSGISDNAQGYNMVNCSSTNLQTLLWCAHSQSANPM